MFKEKISNLYSKKQGAKKNKKIENEKSPEQKRVEKNWKNFKKIFWSLFIFKIIFTVILTSVNLEKDITIILLFLQLIPIILMAITMAIYAYKFSGKKYALLVGLLGFFWFAIIGIFIGYLAVQTIKKSKLNSIKS